MFVFECEGYYALSKRPDNGLLAGLWQFPDTPGALELPDAIALTESWGVRIRNLHRQLEKKHIFTHIVWNMRMYHMEVKTKCDGFFWFSGEEIRENAALPTAYRQFWEAIEHD